MMNNDIHQWLKDYDNPRWYSDTVMLVRAEQIIRTLLTWQPIETAPKDGSLILLYPSRCWASDCDRGEMGYWDGEEWVGVGPRAEDYTGPTHWMCIDPPEAL